MDPDLVKTKDANKPIMRGANKRPAQVKTPAVHADATANLTGWYGQQIPFSSIVSSGALVKNSNGSYSQGGGFTEGGRLLKLC